MCCVLCVICVVCYKEFNNTVHVLSTTGLLNTCVNMFVCCVLLFVVVCYVLCVVCYKEFNRPTL